jgi:putative membrane protein
MRNKNNFLWRWLLATLAVIVAAYLIPRVHLSGFLAALVAALILGLVNTIIKPILLILTLPINLLTLGLFTLVINALMVLLTSAIVPGFAVNGFWNALIFSVVLSLINWFFERAERR